MYNKLIMIIGGLQKNTLIDFPGKIACTVFLAGCNFRCPWCYSPELVLPEKIKEQPKLSKEEFFAFLEEKKDLLGGVVVCGGEPCLNDDLPDFVKKIKEMGFAVKIDTNGTNPEMPERLINERLIDYVAMDMKNCLLKYDEATGIKADLEKIKKSVDVLKEGKVDFEFRTTAVPTVHVKEDFIEIAKWIGGRNVKYYLQSFRPEKNIDPRFGKIKPYFEEYLKDIAKEISPYFKICQLR